jgi:hypothetical protein
MRMLAYIDAGTGSLFIQAVIGSILAGGVMLRGVAGRVLSRRKVNQDTQRGDEQQ